MKKWGRDNAESAPVETVNRDGESDEQSPALTSIEHAALRTLNTFSVDRLASISEIVGAMPASIRISIRTATPAIRKLIRLGLAERPEGDRRGVRLTLKGRRLAAKYIAY